MRIRPFSFEDVPSFRQTLDAVARERKYLILVQAPPLDETGLFARKSLAGGTVHFVAEEAGEVVGWCDISPRHEPGFQHSGRLGMGVLAMYRGRGLGQQLLDAAIQQAFAQGLSKIDLEVFASNERAIALYRRNGFREEGRRRKARRLDDEWDDLILMARFREEGTCGEHSIVQRVEREAGVPGLASLLGEQLPPTDLQSLLLEVYRLRATQRSPAAILDDSARSRFTRPSVLRPAVLSAWEHLAFTRLPGEFTALELSPVCPLGTCSGVASVDPKLSVATVRNTEVVSDPTNVLALECALRRKQLLREDPKSTARVNLAASHRVLRPQIFAGAHSFAHFHLFCLVTAGRDEGDRRFEMAALAEHARFYVGLLRAFAGEGLPLRLAFSDFGADDRGAVLERQLLAPLREDFGVQCELYPERSGGRGYYRDLCMKIYATTSQGEEVEIGDGGSVDWTQRLLSNAKERLLTSGLGAERICLLLAPEGI